MKLSQYRIVLFVLGAALLAASAAWAQAAKTPAAIILVVDMMRVQDQAVAAKSVQTQIRDFEAKLQAQAKAAEVKLKDDEAKLKQQQTILAPDQFDAQRRAFETRVGEEQRKLQERQRDIQIAVRKAQGALLQALEPVLKELLAERGGNILVDRRMILTAADNLDVTNSVIERLDKRIKSLKVEVVKQK